MNCELPCLKPRWWRLPRLVLGWFYDRKPWPFTPEKSGRSFFRIFEDHPWWLAAGHGTKMSEMCGDIIVHKKHSSLAPAVCIGYYWVVWMGSAPRYIVVKFAAGSFLVMILGYLLSNCNWSKSLYLFPNPIKIGTTRPRQNRAFGTWASSTGTRLSWWRANQSSPSCECLGCHPCHDLKITTDVPTTHEQLHTFFVSENRVNPQHGSAIQ